MWKRTAGLQSGEGRLQTEEGAPGAWHAPRPSSSVLACPAATPQADALHQGPPVGHGAQGRPPAWQAGFRHAIHRRTPTWQVEQGGLCDEERQLLHHVPQRKHRATQAAHQKVEQMEHLLRGPPVFGHPQLDADDLDLHVGRVRGERSALGGAACPAMARGSGQGREFPLSPPSCSVAASTQSAVPHDSMPAEHARQICPTTHRPLPCHDSAAPGSDPATATHQCHHGYHKIGQGQKVISPSLPCRVLVNVFPPGSGPGVGGGSDRQGTLPRLRQRPPTGQVQGPAPLQTHQLGSAKPNSSRGRILVLPDVLPGPMHAAHSLDTPRGGRGDQRVREPQQFREAKTPLLTRPRVLNFARYAPTTA